LSKYFDIEKQIVQALKAAHAVKMTHPEVLKLIKTAQKMMLAGKHDKAGASFGALSTFDPTNIDFPLRAGQAYQKAKQNDDASRWYLRSAERYAKQDYPAQAFAAIRLYHSIKPDEHKGPKRIFKLLRERGETGETIVPFLSSKDKAAQKLRPNDFFSLFDDDAFETLMENMIYRRLEDGEILSKMGDEAKSLYFIIQGEIDGYLTLHGKRSHLGTLHDICGETAYFTGGRSTSEMVAVGDVEILELPYAMLDSLKLSSPKLSTHLEQLYRSRMLVKQLTLAPLFDAVPAELRIQIAQKMTLVHIPAGQTLMRDGETAQNLFLVRSGKLAVSVMVEQQERMLKTLETGAVVGEVAVSVGGKHTATVRTLSDCALMRLTAQDYDQFYQQSPVLQKLVHERKLSQMAELRSLIKGIRTIEGDDTCELLLRDIWQS